MITVTHVENIFKATCTYHILVHSVLWDGVLDVLERIVLQVRGRSLWTISNPEQQLVYNKQGASKGEDDAQQEASQEVEHGGTEGSGNSFRKNTP